MPLFTRRSVGATLLTAGCMLAFGLTSWFQDSPGWMAPQQVYAAEPDGLQPVPAGNYDVDLKPFLQKYCADCHVTGSQAGDFAVDHYNDLDSILKNRRVWAKLLKLVELGSMPPSDADQPSEEERAKVVAWLQHELFYVDCNVEQNPGRVTVRRLNRTEYNNTVNSLLGIQFHPADNFPSDDVGHGFDNIGDVLTVPPLLIEKYLAAAEEISLAAISTRSPVYFQRSFFGADTNKRTNEEIVQELDDGHTFGTNGTIEKSISFPRDGEYVLKILARQDKGGDDDSNMVVKLGTEELKTFKVDNTDSNALYALPFNAAQGTVNLSISFTNDFWNPEAAEYKDRNLFINNAVVEGPLGLTPEEEQTRHLMWFKPDESHSVYDAALKNLSTFLPRAFRRQVTDGELARYAGLAELAIQHGGTFEDGMRLSLQAILVSPDFLFRMESGRRQQGEVESLDDYALASRLSYFLWSSCPDDELFQIAEANQLHEPEVLRAQTLRMLQDPKSEQLVTNFSGQWLGLRKLTTNEVDPDRNLFPEFDAQLREDLWKETELFFSSIVKEDRSLFELLTGRYSYLNERLAKLYGIEDVTGPEFRKVELAGEPRLGVLTQGSILTLTSYPNRTSPVKRGQWVLEVLLGDAPPPPPPAVPGLEATSQANPNLTLRESLELHRRDPGCASCHNTMDAIGFGLENFDAIGRWRTEMNGQPVDASGVLPSGEEIKGPEDLVNVLMSKQENFARCFTEKMMTYAIGRGVDWQDRCAVDSILQNLQQDDRFSTLVLGIVSSAPFQSRKLQDQVATSR